MTVENSSAVTPAPGSAETAPNATGLRPWAGRALREIRLHIDRIGQRSDLPRAVFFANQNWDDSASSNFRCAQIATGLRSLGWRTTCVPPHLSFEQRMRLLRFERPSIIYIQNARNERNQPKLYKHIAPCVFDLDDADYQVPQLRKRYEAAACEAAAVTVGSHMLAEWARKCNANVHVVWTCHPPPPVHATIPQSQRGPVIGWAQNGWATYLKERTMVRDIVLKAHETVPCEFHLFAVKDEHAAAEYVAPLRGAGVVCELVPYLPNEQFLEKLEHVAVGLHALDASDGYSRAKSFGKLLSYSAARVAIVASNNLETPKAFTHGENALLCSTVNEMAIAVAGLLNDATRRETLADGAWRNLGETFSPIAVCRKIDGIFRGVMERQKV